MTKKTAKKTTTKKTATPKAKRATKNATKAKNGGNGKSIRQAIIELMRTKGVDNVTKDECEAVAKGIKKDTAWKDTHFYYYRKIVKKMLAEEQPKPETKKTKKTKRTKK